MPKTSTIKVKSAIKESILPKNHPRFLMVVEKAYAQADIGHGIKWVYLSCMRRSMRSDPFCNGIDPP